MSVRDQACLFHIVRTLSMQPFYSIQPSALGTFMVFVSDLKHRVRVHACACVRACVRVTQRVTENWWRN